MKTLKTHCSLRSLSLTLLLSLGHVAPASAQAVNRFDPQTHLTGYHEAFLGDFGDLYNFTPFQDLVGRKFDAVQMETLRKRWEDERQRVTDRIAMIQTDPRQGYLYAVDKRLRRSKFFQQTELVRIDTFAPYYFFVERPFKRQDEFEERFVHLVAPWVQKLGEVFRATYTEPEKLTQNPKSPCFAVVVLASKGRYSDYSEAVKNPGLYWSEAHYDPDLRLAITYRGESSYAKAAESIRRALLHEFVHALQHAYAKEDLPQEPWLVEGMAEYLSYSTGDQPTALAQRNADRGAVEYLTPFTAPPVNDLLLPGIVDLASCRNYGDVVSRARKKLKANNVRAVPDTFILAVHYAHAGLLLHFLHHGEAGKYAAATRRYFALALGGKSGPSTLAEAFEGVDLAKLDAEFLRYVRELYRGYFPDRKLENLPAMEESLSVEAVAARTPFDPSALKPDLSTGEHHLALAIVTARSGAMQAAATSLREWLATGSQEPVRARIEVELARVDAFLGVRERFVQSLIQSKLKVDFEVPEGRLLAVIEGVEGSVLQLGTNRLKLATIDLERLAPTELADLMRDKKYGALAHWAMAYPYVLAGGTSGKLRLFDTSADSRRLEEDTTRDYPARIGRGEALAALDELSRAGAALDATNADTLLTRAQEFYRRQDAPDVLDPKRDALRGLARAALQRKFDALGLSEVLSGTVRDVGQERIEITYDFEHANQASDFAAVDPHYALQVFDRSSLPRLASKFEVENGALQALGLACARHVLALEAPSIEYRVSIEEPDSNDPLIFVVGLCDDAYGSFLSSFGLGSLMLLDKASGHVATNEGALSNVMLGQVYTIRLANDGQICKAFVDGREVGRLPILARPSGHTLLSNGMNRTLKFHDIKIEGKLTDTSRAALRAKWIDEELTRRGFAGS